MLVPESAESWGLPTGQVQRQSALSLGGWVSVGRQENGGGGRCGYKVQDLGER